MAVGRGGATRRAAAAAAAACSGQCEYSAYYFLRFVLFYSLACAANVILYYYKHFNEFSRIFNMHVLLFLFYFF